MSPPLVRPSPVSPAAEVGDELVARVRAGDIKAFETVFLTYYDRLIVIARQYLRSQADAEDVVQDAFSRLWARRAQWVVETSIRAYLYTAVRYAALKAIRHERVVARHAEGVTDPDTVGPMGTWDNTADAATRAGEARAVLVQAVATLTPRMQQAYRLRVEHELSYAEIAEVMGILPKAVEKLIARAKDRLHEALAPYWAS